MTYVNSLEIMRDVLGLRWFFKKENKDFIYVMINTCHFAITSIYIS